MMTTPRATASLDLPALLTGAVGLGCLAAGAVWPWFTGYSGPVGTLPTAWLLWLSVLASALALVAAVWRVDPRWVWVAGAVAVAAPIGALIGAEMGWLCWDGVDGDGNMVGGCEQDEWTPMPAVFVGGLVLVAVAIVRASLAQRRPSR